MEKVRVVPASSLCPKHFVGGVQSGLTHLEFRLQRGTGRQCDLLLHKGDRICVSFDSEENSTQQLQATGDRPFQKAVSDPFNMSSHRKIFG